MTTARTFVLLFALAALSIAQGIPIRLLDDVDPSPDGKRIVFAWRGDIWTARSLGGDARRLTFDDAEDRQPRWSPNGREIAFVSDRSGSNQVWVMPDWGGAPSQITLNTDGYQLLEWTPDGGGFLVRGARDHFWRDAPRLFIQSRDGRKAPDLLFDDYGEDATLSPDGRRLLFTREGAPLYRKRYQGSQAAQTWIYDRDGDTFTRLAAHTMGSRWPLWGANPDTWYTVDQENGAWNVYRASLVTDERTQMTRFEDDGVRRPRISRDGSTIVFSRLFDLYRLDVGTGRVHRIEISHIGDPTIEVTQRIALAAASESAFAGDGREIAFVAGGDLWVMDTELREPVQVTNTPEEESSPLFSKDYKTLYFISDAEGQTDIWSATPMNQEKAFWLNTEFTLKRLTNDDVVESDLRLWDKGRRLAYHKASHVGSMDLESGKEEIHVVAFDKPRFDFSPDGKWIAWSTADNDFNHDIWIRPLDGSRQPFNLSVHPDNDRDPKWSADGRMLAFIGRRWGDESDIVYVNLRRDEDEETSRQRRLKKALKKMEGRKKKGTSQKPATEAPKPATPEAPEDVVSGTWKGTIMGPLPLPPAGLAMTFNITLGADDRISGSFETLLGSGQVIRGRFDRSTKTLDLVFDVDGEQFLVKGTIEGKTATGTWEGPMGDGTWTAERTEPAQPATTPPAKPEEKETTEADATKAKPKPKKEDEIEVRIDFDGIHDRLRRITLSGSGESNLLWTPKGRKLYFTGTVGGQRGTYSVEFPDELTPKKFATSIPGNAEWLEDGQTLAANIGGKPSSISNAGKVTSHDVSVRMEVDVAAQHRAIFDEAWRIMRDSYYDGRLGNNDWNAIRTKYQGMAGECLDAPSLGTVVNMMLGELNGSHLGFSIRDQDRNQRGTRNQWTTRTGHLGARFDPDHTGPGLRVRDVIDGTPASRRDSTLETGDVILRIDGVEVDPRTEIAVYLTGDPNRHVDLEVRNPQGEIRNVTILPTTSSRVRGQLYETWIKDNRERVDRLSGGTLGYLHIAGMGGGNLVRFDAELYRVGSGKDGLVIDVRENGGGSITDHLLTSLCQPSHAITRPRNGGPGYPHDRRIYATWSKPIVVLCNQNSFSNAEIFSHAVKTLGRGKVVGVPTAGGVISTGGASVMGRGFIRTPFRGWHLPDGQDMELNGCVPDVTVWPEPGEMPAGQDRQLERAVQVLSADVREWKQEPRPPLIKASER
jgi:Tol biopolymer transport system component/C-terminal processing protease CtpA/Prc